jgi:hypothetical protein
MAKKKAGSLSGTMIVRDRRKDTAGFVYGEGSSTAERRKREDQRGSPEPGREDTKDAVAAVRDCDDEFAGGETRTKDSAPPLAPSSGADAPLSDLLVSAESGKVVALYPDRQADPVIGESTSPEFSGLEIQNADDLVAALRSADIAEAEDIFASMTGLNHVDVLRLLYGPDGKDLALVCRALGMEQLQFVSVYILSRKLGLGEEAIDPRDLARIVAFFEATDETEAVAALARWRAAEAEDKGNPAGPV